MNFTCIKTKSRGLRLLRQRRGNSLPVGQANGEAPFGKLCVSLKSFGDRAERLSSDGHAAFVGGGEFLDQRLESAPGHRRGPLQGGLDRIQDGPVPMLLQDAPAAFDGVVFAVVRREVHPFDFSTLVIGKLDQAFEKLRSRTTDFRSVIQFNHQSLHAGMSGPALRPPLDQRIDDEIGGLARATEDHIELINRVGPP